MPGIFDHERGDPEPIRANPFGTWPIWPLDYVAKSLKWPTLRHFPRLARSQMGYAGGTTMILNRPWWMIGKA